MPVVGGFGFGLLLEWSLYLFSVHLGRLQYSIEQILKRTIKSRKGNRLKEKLHLIPAKKFLFFKSRNYYSIVTSRWLNNTYWPVMVVSGILQLRRYFIILFENNTSHIVCRIIEKKCLSKWRRKLDHVLEATIQW